MQPDPSLRCTPMHRSSPDGPLFMCPPEPSLATPCLGGPGPPKKAPKSLFLSLYGEAADVGPSRLCLGHVQEWWGLVGAEGPHQHPHTLFELGMILRIHANSNRIDGGPNHSKRFGFPTLGPASIFGANLPVFPSVSPADFLADFSKKRHLQT